MAAFLVHFPGWKPDEYLALTQRELAALVEAHGQAQK